MNKKIVLISMTAVLMMMTISFVSAVTTNTQTTRKESPLFQIRTNTRINRVENIITNFLQRDRIFIIPNLLQKSSGITSDVTQINGKTLCIKGSGGNYCNTASC